jgi:hypothetical protein
MTDVFFERFNWVMENCDSGFGKKYVNYLTPTYADLDYVCEKLAATIETIPEDQAIILRAAKDKLDVLNQIRAGRKLSQEYIGHGSSSN